MEGEIKSAKLYVKCPCCPRSLQMRECRSIVPKEVYQTLVKRVNEAEKEHGDDKRARTKGV